AFQLFQEGGSSSSSARVNVAASTSSRPAATEEGLALLHQDPDETHGENKKKSKTKKTTATGRGSPPVSPSGRHDSHLIFTDGRDLYTSSRTTTDAPDFAAASRSSTFDHNARKISSSWLLEVKTALKQDAKLQLISNVLAGPRDYREKVLADLTTTLVAVATTGENSISNNSPGARNSATGANVHLDRSTGIARRESDEHETATTSPSPISETRTTSSVLKSLVSDLSLEEITLLTDLLVDHAPLMSEREELKALLAAGELEFAATATADDAEAGEDQVENNSSAGVFGTRARQNIKKKAANVKGSSTSKKVTFQPEFDSDSENSDDSVALQEQAERYNKNSRTTMQVKEATAVSVAVARSDKIVGKTSSKELGQEHDPTTSFVEAPNQDAVVQEESRQVTVGEIPELTDETRRVLCMDVTTCQNRTAEMLATGTLDSKVRIYTLEWHATKDAFSVTQLSCLTEHYDAAQRVRWHPSEPVLASGGADGHVFLYKPGSYTYKADQSSGGPSGLANDENHFGASAGTRSSQAQDLRHLPMRNWKR
ncbi:unnamed protein product, partial [Amoebophrya sp. A120]